jgi:hypothetical protein
LKYFNSYKIRFLLVLLSVLLLFLIPYVNHLNQMPLGMHGWAQSDRYAIALNFLSEDNVLTPKTNALYTEEGKVGVEFSGVAYMAAKMAIICNSKVLLPLFFRSINLFFLALCITFFLTSLLDFDIGKSLISFLLWFATPLLLFYGYNFIPDSLGFGLAMAALGLYFLYYQKGNALHLALALTIGSLGGLIKLPVLLYPIAIITHQIYLNIKSKKFERNKLLSLVTGTVSIICVLAYDYFYLIEANSKLWSVIFMGKPNPILNFKDLIETIEGIFYWRFEFFNMSQYVVLTIFMVWMLIKRKSIPVFYKELGIIILIGLVVYFVGLGKQLIHHDYYFLSSFLPFLLFVATLQTKRILKSPRIERRILLLVIASTLSFNNFTQAKERQNDYYTIRGNTLDNNLTWLKNGEKKLDNFGVGPNEDIFVLYDFAPNTSLVYFNRKGLVFNHEQMSRKEPHIEVWLEKINPNYIIVKSDWEKDFFRDKPNLAHSWKRFPQDGFILYKKP